MKRIIVLALLLGIVNQLNAQIIPDFGASFESYADSLTFRLTKGIELNDIETDGETVYIGTNKGLFAIKGRNIFPPPKINGENSNLKYNITHIHIDDKNEVWLGTRIPLILKLNKQNSLSKITLNRASDTGYEINTLFKTKNTLWIGNNIGGIIAYDLNNKTQSRENSSYKGNVNAIYADGSKIKGVGRDNGLFYKTPQGGSWLEMKHIKSISKIKKVGDTYWALGKHYNGSSIIFKSKDLQNWDSFKNKLACVSQAIEFIDFDIDARGRNIWIATNNGVVQYNFELDFCNWFYKKKYPEFKMNEVSDIAAQNDSTVWVGSSKGDVYKITIYPKEYDEELLAEMDAKKKLLEAENDDMELPPKRKLFGRKDNAEEKVEEKVEEKTEEVVAQVDPVAEEKRAEEMRKAQEAKKLTRKATKQKSMVRIEDIKCGETLELSQLFFKTNAAEFMNEDKALDYLDILVLYLQQNPTHTIELYGHTDFLSNNKEFLYNLSKDRVETVRDLLANEGISKNRIKTEAFGGDKPIVTDKVSKSRSQNRRVELYVNCQ